MSDNKKNGNPIAATIALIVLVAILFGFGSLTCNQFDTGGSFTIIGIVGCLVIFAVIVYLIKSLMKGKDSDK